MIIRRAQHLGQGIFLFHIITFEIFLQLLTFSSTLFKLLSEVLSLVISWPNVQFSGYHEFTMMHL